MSTSVRWSRCHPETSLRSTQTRSRDSNPVLLNAGQGPQLFLLRGPGAIGPGPALSSWMS